MHSVHPTTEEAAALTEHKIGTRQEWLAGRRELLERAPKGADDDVPTRRHDEY